MLRLAAFRFTPNVDGLRTADWHFPAISPLPMSWILISSVAVWRCRRHFHPKTGPIRGQGIIYAAQGSLYKLAIVATAIDSITFHRLPVKWYSSHAELVAIQSIEQWGIIRKVLISFLHNIFTAEQSSGTRLATWLTARMGISPGASQQTHKAN